MLKLDGNLICGSEIVARIVPNIAVLPENLGVLSMSVETSTSGVEIGLCAVLENYQDTVEPILSRLQI